MTLPANQTPSTGAGRKENPWAVGVNFVLCFFHTRCVVFFSSIVATRVGILIQYEHATVAGQLTEVSRGEAGKQHLS